MVEVLTAEPRIVPDVYFTRSYGQTDAVTTHGRWVTLADREGLWQMPLVVTPLDERWSEATSPYGYSGIYVGPESAGLSASARESRWRAARDILRDMGVVSLFLRFSPMDPGSAHASTGLEGLDVRENGSTFVVPIGEPAEMWRRLASSCRNKVRKALKNGHTAQVRTATLADVLPGGSFRELYEQTMARVDAERRYWFSDEYYRRLVTSVRPAPLVAEVMHGQAVVASSLILRHAERGHYHLAGSDPDAARMGANSLMVWTILEWCSSAGVRQCHLGGGLTEGDGLATFKRSFGGQPARFFVGTSVIDPAAYASLTRARAEQLGTSQRALEERGFFPAFRADDG